MESRLALAETDGDGERGAEYGNRRAYILHPVSQTRSLTPYASSLQGGVSDEVTLSAYITAAFLEMNMYIDVS